ncbi:MAG: hypothetical protein JSV62_09650 [Promethearchaeota archaeon]|nr:MAG: hypothetical protein JSV62_09650 [Candidatus Lokiarchaeota archaeon]
MKKTVLYWEIIGIIFIVLIGALFHFMFELSNYWRPLGAIFPVNESVWEHLKLPYWPLIIFSLIEYGFIRKDANNFILGKTISFIIAISTIMIIFYSYTAIFGVELLIVDILSFVLGVIIGQIVSYKIITTDRLSMWYANTSWIIFIGFGIMFAIFTYFPPNLLIFQDSETGLYGIIEHFIRF